MTKKDGQSKKKAKNKSKDIKVEKSIHGKL